MNVTENDVGYKTVQTESNNSAADNVAEFPKENVTEVSEKMWI